MKRMIAIIICIIGLSFPVFSENNTGQEAEVSIQGKEKPAKVKEPLTNRINIGGNIGAGFSNNYFFANIQPRVSYQVTKWLIPGVSLDYQFSRRTSGNTKSTYNTYGVGAFVDIYPIRFIYARVEYQHLWHSEKSSISAVAPYKSENNYLLLGAGARIPIAGRTYVTASVLFNVLDNGQDNIYQNPIYSVGIGTSL